MEEMHFNKIQLTNIYKYLRSNVGWICPGDGDCEQLCIQNCINCRFYRRFSWIYFENQLTILEKSLMLKILIR